MYPQPEIRTSQTQLLGTTTGIIVTAVVAVVGLVVLLVPVFLADNPPDIRRLTTRRQREVSGSRSPTAISSSGQGSRPWERMEDRHVPPAGHLHGKPSSWLLVATVMGAFTTGGVAIIVHAWWLFWACAGIVVLAIPAGKLIGIMDDTIAWGSTSAAAEDPPHDQEARPRPDQPVPTRR